MSNIKKVLLSVMIVSFAFVAASTEANAAFTRSLSQGSKGPDVMELQQFLNLCADTQVATFGAGSAGMETMYFGPATKSAVMRFQAKHGVFPVAGYFGPLSQSKVAMLKATGNICGTGPVNPNLPAGCTSMAGYSMSTGVKCDSSSTGGNNGGNTGNTGSLNGTVGSLDYSLVSNLSNEEVGEDESDVKIAGLEIDAEDSDSDVRITAVKINFDRGSASTSTDFEDVAEEVTIWLGNTKVGSVDADEFDDDNDEEKTITLSNAIVRMNDSEDLVVAVSGASSIDTGDLSDTWTVDFTQIRFVDAQGATTTEDPTVGTRTFSFESFATANDVELNVSLNDDEDDINDAHSITVDDSDQTDDVAILAFTLEADGDADVTVNEIPVRLVTSTANLSTVVSTVYLYHGTTEVGSEDISSANTSETVTFDDLDIEVGAGDEEEFWVKVDLMGTDEFHTAGTTIQASVTVASIDAEDETGEELGSGDLTGSASGDAHGLYEDGIAVTPGSTTATANEGSTSAGDAYGTFTIKFSVTAVGTDVFLDKTFVSTSTLTGSSQAVVLTTTGVDLTNDSSLVLASTDSDASEQTNSFRINEGRTADFTLSLASSVNPDANLRAVLYNLAWGASDGAATANNYSFDMGVDGSYKTNYVFVQD